jgi:hypothetical protein
MCKQSTILGHIWDRSLTRLGYIWYIYWTYLEYIWDFYEKYLGPTACPVRRRDQQKYLRIERKNFFSLPFSRFKENYKKNENLPNKR